MKDLNKEAEEFSNKYGKINKHERIFSFIAVANSNYVKRQILQWQIDILCKQDSTIDIDIQIEELKQQLKDLENE